MGWEFLPMPYLDSSPGPDLARREKHRTRGLKMFVAGAVLVASVISALAFLLGLFQEPSRTFPNASGKPQDVSATTGQWQAQTVRHGLEELKDPANQALPPLAITTTPPESMPSDMRRKVHETIGPSRIMRLQFAQAQHVRTQIGIGVWVVEGRGVTCAVRGGVGSATCQTSVRARRHGLLLEVYRVGRDPAAPPTHFTAFGVAPNWARIVVVRIGHHRKEIPVVNHAYALRAKQPIEVQRLVR